MRQGTVVIVKASIPCSQYLLSVCRMCTHGAWCEDTFNAKMSIIISSKKQNKLSVESGFYSEKAMKDDLGFARPLK